MKLMAMMWKKVMKGDNVRNQQKNLSPSPRFAQGFPRHPRSNLSQSKQKELVWLLTTKDQAVTNVEQEGGSAYRDAATSSD